MCRFCYSQQDSSWRHHFYGGWNCSISNIELLLLDVYERCETITIMRSERSYCRVSNLPEEESNESLVLFTITQKSEYGCNSWEIIYFNQSFLWNRIRAFCILLQDAGISRGFDQSCDCDDHNGYICVKFYRCGLARRHHIVKKRACFIHFYG